MTQERRNGGHTETWHGKHEAGRTTSERVADTVAHFVGSWNFIILQTTIILLWVGLNVLGYIGGWDPFPFILLNLLFSAQAAYTAPIIMMAQNRQNARDRAQSLADYETNLLERADIERIASSLRRLESEKLDRILALLEERKGN